MRGILFVACLCFGILSCTKPAKRIDIQLKNSTSRTITFKAKAGFFKRVIRLKPGETWIGWVPASFKIKDISIEVKEK